MIHRELKSPTSKKQREERNKEFPRVFIAVNLGIVCLLFLLKSMSIGYLMFQCSSGCKVQDKKHINVSKDSSLAVGHHSVLPPAEEIDYDTCYGKWSCCGKNCYYFSKDVNTWDGSKKSCERRGSSLIKVNDEVKQKYIQSKLQLNYWIGLYTKEANGTWKWLDDTKISTKMKFQLTTTDAKCGQIKLTTIASAVCTIPFHYICEKKIQELDN